MCVVRLDVVRVSFGVGLGHLDLSRLAAEQPRAHQLDRAARALTHLARRRADDVADRGALDRDRRAARRLHALQQHAQPLAHRVVLVADGIGGGLQAALELDVVHDLAGGEDVAVAQQVHAAQLERAHVERGRERVHRPLRRPD
jgi:hypothetical protein